MEIFPFRFIKIFSLIVCAFFGSCNKESLEPLYVKLIYDFTSSKLENTVEPIPEAQKPTENPSIESGADTIAPSIAVNDIQTKLIKATSFSIEWTKANDNKTKQEELQYKVVYSSSNNISTIEQAESTGEGRVLRLDWTKDKSDLGIDSLVVSTNYYVTVLVKDEANNKSIYKTKLQNTYNVYDNMNATVSHYSANKTFTKCSIGQSWNQTLNNCAGIGDGGNGYGFSSYQYCSNNNHDCNSQHPTWQLNGSGDSSLFRVCDELILGGHSDWRVPNLDELRDFYQLVYSPNKNLFPQMIYAFYFSSSAKWEFLGDTFAKAVHMENGSVTDLKFKTESSPVICIREGRE